MHDVLLFFEKLVLNKLLYVLFFFGYVCYRNPLQMHMDRWTTSGKQGLKGREIVLLEHYPLMLYLTNCRLRGRSYFVLISTYPATVGRKQKRRKKKADFKLCRGAG